MAAKTLSLAAALTIGAVALPAGAHNAGLPAVPIQNSNLAHHNNVPDLVGNSLAFFERKLADGSVRRYLVAGTVGNGFDIVDITDPHEPETVGRYLLGDGTDQAAVQNSSAGANYHAWVDVNPRRNIVVVSVEEPGATVRHNGGNGLTFVDISDVQRPVPLSTLEQNVGGESLGGPHTVRMVGDHCVYLGLSGQNVVVDYTDPTDPKAYPRPGMALHEVFEDPNHPRRAYVGLASPGRWAIWDTSDCLNPREISSTGNPGLIDTAHLVYPAPDSSYVGVSDYTTSGQRQTECPGGGIHFYDISGKYVDGASLTDPRLIGSYYAPFSGAAPATLSLPPNDPNPVAVNHASCTMHSWQINPEREVALGALYAGGTWVIDPSHAAQANDGVPEYDGRRGKTTWGNTIGANRDAFDFVNQAQWYPFDTSDPDLAKQVFTVGWERGLDIYTYTGQLPKKMARLRLDATAGPAGVTGTLDRYAVLTHTGWRNLPLAGRVLTLSAGGSSVEVITAGDGSFTADLGLARGVHEVTATWAGDDDYRGESLTRTVAVP